MKKRAYLINHLSNSQGLLFQAIIEEKDLRLLYLHFLIKISSLAILMIKIAWIWLRIAVLQQQVIINQDCNNKSNNNNKT